ncbi:hypothetical protein [Plasticicumulans acidivorans]|uniref:Uncharacterized protein n=1 Tax=Plasticicumulans acidivorans TaxID=886464 RepID=A0A317N1K9_9GAMM|nr:hypothetical protein [Plasticicumulans acidivorans]PWV66014.1 hypothetical protein C7443_101502 [Plasticicumulans acidivorans]
MILLFATVDELLEYIERDSARRLDDLAQTIAAWPLQKRRDFLERWEQRHGSADALRERLQALWRVRSGGEP